MLDGMHDLAQELSFELFDGFIERFFLLDEGVYFQNDEFRTLLVKIQIFVFFFDFFGFCGDFFIDKRFF